MTDASKAIAPNEASSREAMSDKKQFAIVMLLAAMFIAWILSDSIHSTSLNERLLKDKTLQAYPYPFRVLEEHDGVVTMSTLHGENVSLTQGLRTVFPELQDVTEDSPEMIEAQKKFAGMQARAQQIMIQHEEIDAVQWVVDESWLRLNKYDLPVTLR